MVKEIKNFERRNNVSVNVYYWDECVKPLKTVEEEKDTHVDLFLLKDEETRKKKMKMRKKDLDDFEKEDVCWLYDWMDSFKKFSEKLLEKRLFSPG